MDTESVNELITEQFQVTVYAYAGLAGAVLAIYDTLLGLGDEINVIYGKKFNMGSFLYLLARYGSIANGVLATGVNLYDIYGTNLKARLILEDLEILSSLANLFGAVGVHLLLLTRAYAVSGGKLTVGSVLVLLFVTNIGSAIASLAVAIATNNVVVPKILITVTDLNGGLSLLSEAAVTIITLYFAWREYKNIRNLFGKKNISLTVILVRQGVFRFIIILIWGLEINIARELLPPFIRGVDVTIEDSISAILVCRFLLELRKFNTSPQSIDIETIQAAPGIRGQLRRLNESVLEDFGNSSVNYEASTEIDNVIDNQETFPRATPSAEMDTEQRMTDVRLIRTITPVENTVGDPSRTG